jgi:hypothetical protein
LPVFLQHASQAYEIVAIRAIDPLRWIEVKEAEIRIKSTAQLELAASGGWIFRKGIEVESRRNLNVFDVLGLRAGLRAREKANEKTVEVNLNPRPTGDGTDRQCRTGRPLGAHISALPDALYGLRPISCRRKTGICDSDQENSGCHDS